MGLHLNQGDDELVENHEINVTPFIDVMLVLLIIFMVAAPLATVDIKVDLPASSAKPAPRPEKPIFLSVKADQRLFLGEEEVKSETLGAVLDAKTQGKKDTTIFFQADKADLDVSGTWINQAAIDAAAKGGPLREALQSYGPNLEWEVNTKASQARYYNGFEVAEGKLLGEKSGAWSVDFYGGSATELKRKGKLLLQGANDNEPEQLFARAKDPAPEGAPLGANFERTLYAAYMGGTWKISSGNGEGATVQFQANGQVTGLPGADQYSLCLAGDCASMSGGYDSIWLQLNGQGNPWIFARKGKQLEIFQAINTAQADEVPSFTPGPRQWLLEKQ